MHIAYIAIGSNIENPSENIKRAIDELSSHELLFVKSKSKIRQYPALTKDNEKQPDYLNAVVEIKTRLEPTALLDLLQLIEREFGRPIEHGKWQPRKIDLDILLYDSIVLNEERLAIPHPEMEKRIFVLEPLCDIAPDIEHPVLELSVKELLKQLTNRAGNA